MYCPKDTTQKALPKRHHSQGTAQRHHSKGTAQKTPLTRHCPKTPLTRHCQKTPLTRHCSKTLAKRHNSKPKELNLIWEDQYGFKKGLCTMHALLVPTQRITHRFNSHTITLTLFLDKEQACDNVRTTGHISRYLSQQECQFTAHSCLNNRTFAAVQGNSESHPGSSPPGQPDRSHHYSPFIALSYQAYRMTAVCRFAVWWWYKCHGSFRQRKTSY